MRNNRLRVLTYFVVCLFLMVWLAPDLTSVQPVYAITFTVNTTADTTDVTPGDGLCADAGGDCSVRAAIQEANAFAGADTIGFNIPGAGTQVITLGSVLPNITQSLIIAGSTQPGYSGTPLIVLDANGIGGNILTVSNTNATLENFRISNASGNAVYLTNADNSVVNSLDLRWTTNTTRTGNGIYSDGITGPVTIQNVRASTRDYGIRFANGTDVQLLNNELLDNNQAVYLVGITAGSLPGGVNIAGNEYTGSGTGLYFQNMADLIISDGSYPGTNVDVTDGSGNETLTSVGSQAIQLSSVDNSRITAVDLSWTVSTAQFGYGILAQTSIDNLIVDNIAAAGRTYGVYVNGGSDVQVLNSDLSRNSTYALRLSSITANILPRAVVVSGNDYSNSSNGLYLITLNNQIISDGSVVNTNIDLTDGGGNHTLTTVTNEALTLNNVDNTTIEAVDVSWLGDPVQRGYGIRSEASSDNLTIQNIAAANRQNGVYVVGGSDVRVLNSNLSNNSTRALHLQTITATSLPGGILVADNTYTNSSHGVYIANQNNLIVSDGSVPGTNVDLTDGGGSHTLTTVSGTALEILNSDNLRVDNLNLSWTGSSSRSGSGLRISNNTSDTVLAQNLTVNNRNMGVFVANAIDVRILNNNLGNNGFDTANYALYLANITANTLPGGVLVQGNDFSNSSYGVRLNALSNLVVSDGSVGGTNVNLTNGGGSHTLSTTNGYALHLNNVDNSTVEALNLSWTGTASRSGTGLFVETSCDNLTLQNLSSTNRVRGIYVGGGIDIRVLNNDLSNSGADTNNFALYLGNATAGSLPGGLQVAGNDFTNSDYGLRLQNLTNQVVSDGSVAGTTIDVTNGVSSHTLTTVSGYALFVRNLDNSVIEAVDVSWLGDSTQRGQGIYSEFQSDNLTIQNVAAANRQTAIYLGGGSDVRVLNSNLSNSGSYALQLSSVLAGSLPGGIQVAGNTYTGSSTGLYLLTLSNIVISDGSVAGTNIDVTDGGGNHTLTTVSNIPILLNNVDNPLVDNVDLSWTGSSGQSGTGLQSDNSSDNVTLQNLTINNRLTGISMNGGSDVRVLNNDLRQNGFDTNRLALYLSAITANTLPGGVLVAGNDFSDSSYGVRINGISGLIISDGSLPGTHVDLTDGNGNHTLTTASGAGLLITNNSDNITISNLDLSWTGSGSRSGFGLYTYITGGSTNDNLTITGVIAQNRTYGLYLGNTTNANISCATILNNAEGIRILSNSSNALVVNTHFQANSTALRWDGAAVLTGENNYWGAADGPSNLGGSGDSYTGNVDANPFLAARPTCAPLGVFEVTTTADTSDGDTSNVMALLADPGADQAISLREAIAAANNTGGSQTINFNIGGGGAQTILLSSALPTISDAVTINGASQPGFAGTTLITIDANGLAGVILPITADNTTLRSLNIANAPGTAISLTGSDGSRLQNVNVAWTGAAAGTGIDVSNSNNVQVTGLTVSNRVTGVNAAASNNLTVGCSVFQTNTTGFSADVTTSALALAYNQIQGNGNGVSNAAAGVLLAENNYWGAATGPFPLGGTGDNYTGNVDAAPFLAALPECLAPSTFVVTTINDVSDGNTSSIANLVGSPGADGAISLREAIAAANNTPGTNTIGFNIGGGGPHTIILGSVLPTLTDAVLLDGSTQPGFSGTPLITLDGGFLNGSLLTLQASNSTIRDLAIRNGVGTALALTNADNAILDNLNLSRTGSTWTGTGLTVQAGSDTVTIQNLTINGRANAIVVSGGTDVQILNNDLSNSGSGVAAIYLSNVTANTLPGGVIVTGNTFANATVSVRFENMTNLIISDGSVGGSNVIFTPAEGLNTATAIPLYLRNVDNSSVNSLNLSWAGLIASGTGFQAEVGCDNLIVQNNTISNRSTGINIGTGTDIQVLNNNLSNNNGYALQLATITAGSLPGGVSIAGNTYSGSTSGVQLTTMANLVISDGSAPGTNVNLTNGGGVHTLTNVRNGTALYLNNVDNSLITNVNLSWLGSGPANQGIAVQIVGGSDTVTVDTITATNRSRGIYVSSGRDVQILNNNLNGSGVDVNNPALYMTGVTSLILPGGVVVTGNTFTNAPNAVRFDSMANLIISDGSVGGSNVIFTLASGLNTVSGRPLFLNSVDNSSVTSLDLSWAGLATSGTGLQANTSIDNLIVQNNTISNRVNAVVISTGSDVQVINNDLSNSSNWALQMTSITGGSLPGSVNVADNNYSNSANGVYLTNMANLVISDGSAGGTNVNLTDGIGTHTLTTVSGIALQLNNVDNTTVTTLNLSWSGFGWLGTGLYLWNGSDTVTLQNLTINNRANGINVNGGRDVQVLNNDLSNSGSGSGNPALYMVNVTSLSLPGGMIVTGNTFANSHTAVRLENLDNLVISDGSVVGSNITFTPASGITTTTNLPLYLRNIDNSSVSNLDLSWAGALPSGNGVQADNGCNNLVIQNSDMSNRGYGVYVDNGTNVDVLNNDLSGASAYGLYMNNVPNGADISGNDFTNDSNGLSLRLMGGMILGATTGLDTVGGTAIALYDVTNSTVDGADISFSGPVRQGTGLLVQATNDNSSNNITLQDAIASNRVTGVNFQRGTNLTVSCTELLNNNTGVLAGQSSTNPNAYNVLLDQNWFQGNNIAVSNPDRTNPTPPPPTIPDPEQTNAENNYWGAADGPSNLGGSGDSYSGNVDADPFGIAIPLCVGADYGDLPAAYNLTTQADNGARHQLGALYLGNYVDFEKDGQESADAGRTAVDGDDGNKDDDEDGVAVVSPWQEGAAGGAVTVALNGGTGCLSGWIDWNDNASFADAGDQIMAMVEVTAGNNSLSFGVPAGALPFDGIYDRFARFRVVPDAGTPNDCSDDTPLALTGTAIDGEVEDYYLRFRKSAPTGTGPGGVGTNDATSSLVLWLAATGGTDTTINGAPVAGWADQSGFGYNASQGTAANQPLYQGNVVNGQPVLRFDNVDDGMSVADGLNLSDPYAVMTVFNSNAAAAPHRAVQGRDSDWLIGPHSGEVRHYAGGWVSTGFALVPGQFYIGGANNLGSASSFWIDGTNQTTNGTFVGSPGRIGLGATGTVADPLGGDLAEVIVYADALNSARRIIVENYLSAKYNLTVSNDRYDGDTPGNGNFDLNVAGIGLEADGDNYRAHSAGMIVVDNFFLINNGDYLLFGHNTVNNGNTNADVPVGGDWNGANDVRWSRHWYVDVTDIGANNGTVDIIFDFSEASMNGGLPPNLPAANYRLLKRAGVAGQFSDITAVSGASVLVVGDQVQFLGVDVAQLGSNFTLGSIDGAASPTAITTQNVASQISQPTYLTLLVLLLLLLAGTIAVVWRRIV